MSFLWHPLHRKSPRFADYILKFVVPNSSENCCYLFKLLCLFFIAKEFCVSICLFSVLFGRADDNIKIYLFYRLIELNTVPGMNFLTISKFLQGTH